MLVDRIILEFTIDFYEILAMNKYGIQEEVFKYVEKRYNEDYNYGVEYYYDYKIVNLQDNIKNKDKRAMINLLIYKDEGLETLQKEAEERLKGGM